MLLEQISELMVDIALGSHQRFGARIILCAHFMSAVEAQ
jgi:hypothetical protein